MSICEEGVEAIKAKLSDRLGRTNLWQKSCKFYFEEDISQVRYSGKGVRSLLDICVSTVVSFKVEFLTQNFVPPRIKRYLYEENAKATGEIKVCKCSRCNKYFSSQANFDGHDCPQIEEKRRVDYGRYSLPDIHAS